jgi:hypothetical protein
MQLKTRAWGEEVLSLISAGILAVLTEALRAFALPVQAVLGVRITAFFDFFHHPVFYKLENTTFWKLNLFPSSGVGGRHLLSWVP